MPLHQAHEMPASPLNLKNSKKPPLPLGLGWFEIVDSCFSVTRPGARPVSFCASCAVQVHSCSWVILSGFLILILILLLIFRLGGLRLRLSSSLDRTTLPDHTRHSISHEFSRRFPQTGRIGIKQKSANDHANLRHD